MYVVPEVLIDKIQVHPTPKNVKEVQVFVGIWGFGKTFNPYLAQCLHPLCCLIKKGHMWDWESEQQAAFEKTKPPTKQIKVLGSPKQG